MAHDLEMEEVGSVRCERSVGSWMIGWVGVGGSEGWRGRVVGGGGSGDESLGWGGMGRDRIDGKFREQDAERRLWEGGCGKEVVEGMNTFQS